MLIFCVIGSLIDKIGSFVTSPRHTPKNQYKTSQPSGVSRDYSGTSRDYGDGRNWSDAIRGGHTVSSGGSQQIRTGKATMFNANRGIIYSGNDYSSDSGYRADHREWGTDIHDTDGNLVGRIDNNGNYSDFYPDPS